MIAAIKTHGSESHGLYSRTHAAIINDATTTRKYFTGRNVVQLQPSETLLLMLYAKHKFTFQDQPPD